MYYVAVRGLVQAFAALLASGADPTAQVLVFVYVCSGRKLPFFGNARLLYLCFERMLSFPLVILLG